MNGNRKLRLSPQVVAVAVEARYDRGVVTRPRLSKRRSKPRALVRGEPVVRGVMEATIEELARTGYGALRIEDVAARAGVNKTTVYRRWPAKEDLVRAALLSLTAGRVVAPDTGALRSDMLAVARNAAALIDSCEGQGLFRLLVAAGPDSQLADIARSIKKGYEAVPRAVIDAAAKRGEIAPGVDGMLLFHVLMPAIHDRIVMRREVVDEAFLVSLVDLLLLGATPRGQRARAPARAGPSRS
jgi:AcrR family transcriptional regulator